MTAPFTIRGAIFDLDGTLLDSMSIREHFSSAYLRSRDITPPPTLDADIATYTLAVRSLTDIKWEDFCHFPKK